MTPYQELHNILFDLKPNAMGNDGINLMIARVYSSPFIIQYIVHLINHAIECSYFQSEWKIAMVLPLSKISSAKTFSDLSYLYFAHYF